MKGLLVLLVAFAVGWFVFAKPVDTCLTQGISPSTPMGTVQCFNKKFSELRLVKISEIQAGLFEIGPERFLLSSYAESGKPAALQGGESVSLFVDDGGRLRAVSGGYLLSSGAGGEHITPVSKFLETYWKQIIGVEPVFSQRFVAESAENPGGVQQFSVAARGSVFGRWTKGTSFGSVLIYDKLVAISHEQLVQEQEAGTKERTFNGKNASEWAAVLLRSSDTEERIQAVQVLGQLGSETVPSLIEALHDAESRVRGRAQRVLIRMGPSTIPKLRVMLEDADDRAAFLAAEVIVKIGKESVPLVVELVKAGYTDSWQRMLSVLHMMVPEARVVAVSELGPLLQDSDNEVMERAWSAMSQMGREMKMGAPFFIQALGGEPRVRQKSRGLLVRNGEMGISILMEALQNPNGEIRLEAAKTLAESDKGRLEGALPELSQLCGREPEQSVRSEICKIAPGGR
jgi:HEAT repeat protein